MFAPRILKPVRPIVAAPASRPARKPVTPPRTQAQIQYLLQASRQKKVDGDRAAIRAAADRGTAGAGGRLPHLDIIQRAFGHHDVSSVVAHSDQGAKAACDTIGAVAFATGNHVAFGRAPSLHTAAHEAAHVVQQRAGVHLRGGMGEAGDAYERQADAVADLVVSGASAAAVLDRGGMSAATPGPIGDDASAVQRLGNGSSDPVLNAPAVSYIVPFDRSPLAAPGERIIFRSVFTDSAPNRYRLEYSTTGGHFTNSVGPVTRTIAGLDSGNVNFFVPKPWNGTTTVRVVLKLTKISDRSVIQTETWNFGLKARYPTTMTQREGTGEVNLPGIYTYDIGPAVASATAPYYEHQTILEKFSKQKLGNIVPADIADNYRRTHGLTTAAAVSAHFCPTGSGGNGTFTVDANDQIADQHSGHDDLSRLVSKLKTPKDIEIVLPQTYEAKPGTTLGSYNVTRILKADGTTWKIKKG